MKALLVNPPHSFSPENPLRGAGLALPPLGLLSVAAYLRREMPGAKVKVLDCPGAGLGLAAFEREVAAFAPDLAGVSVHAGTFSASLAAAAAVKKLRPSCFTVAGGHHASARPSQCLHGFDGAVVGEGEETFSKLAKRLAAGRELAGLAGLALKPGDEPARPAPLDPDSLPFPARDLVDLSLYRPSLFAYRRRPVTSMVTSRGCPYACGFCSKSVFGAAYRAQSPERVHAEMTELAGRYGVKEVSFQDDTFTADRARTLRLCALLKKSPLDLTWSCMTRVDLVDPELLRAMKGAGCFSIAFGVDGAGDASCGLMGKGFDSARAKAAVAAARAAGLETRAYYIFGYPGETRATLAAAPAKMAEVDADHVFIAFAHPFFDTPLYAEARARGLLAVSDEELLDSHDNTAPLVNVPGLTLRQQAKFAKRAYLSYYLRPASLARRLASPRALADSARALLYFLRWY
ncbi:MAG: cobalamin-dependent protein [Elusimicrobiales bacterium]|nr:cobalamin-dependent protein [Elusimicrobiales bacterium]